MAAFLLISAGTTAAQTNTVFGSQALPSPSSSDLGDSAFGNYALHYNTTGDSNTATGDVALVHNTTGRSNTANGVFALDFNTTGGFDTACGFGALEYNTTGGFNTASGSEALYGNSTGSDNTASGVSALHFNTTGGFNTASGIEALNANSTGSNNTASGASALAANRTGSNNIALGSNAGSLITGDNNIDIGNFGVAGESNTIRIGTQGAALRHIATYIAGISNAGVTGATVEVSSAGQLGIVLSSARYKHDIRDMGAKSNALLKLRPVSFRYNNDPANTLQYGLVAEEVERLYPELVTHAADGQVQSVRYSTLTAMLLNELQKQAINLQSQAQNNERLAAEMVAMKASTRRQIAQMKARFEERLATLEQAIHKTNGRKLADAFDSFDR